VRGEKQREWIKIQVDGFHFSFDESVKGAPAPFNKDYNKID